MNYEVGILVALEEELDVVLSCLDGKFSSIRTNNQNILLGGYISIPGKRISTAVHCINEMGPEAGGDGARFIIEHCKPKLLINLGISGAISEDLSLGDIAVGKLIENYAYNVKIDETPSGKIEVKPTHDPHKAWPRLVNIIDSLAKNFPHDLNAWKKLCLDNAKTELALHTLKEPKVVVGPIASGPAVIANTKLKNALKKQNRKLLCVDMESSAISRVCEQNHVNFLPIRAISDFADPSKSELDAENSGAYRTAALYNAATFLPVLLQIANFGELQSPQISDKDKYLDSLITGQYLSYPYDSEKYVRALEINTFDTVFESIFVDHSQSIERIAETALLSKSTCPLRVHGSPGSGKSTFLSLLYWQLKFTIAEHSTTPVYINLSRYSFPKLVGGSVQKKERPLEVAHKHLDPLFRDMSGDHIFIVDGLDPASNINGEVAKFVLESIEATENKIIYGLRNDLNFGEYLAAVLPADKLIEITPIDSEDSKAINKFVSAFFAIIPDSDLTLPALYKRVSHYKVKAIDLFTISLIARQTEDEQSESISLSQLVDRHCMHFIAGSVPQIDVRQDTMNRASRLAFQHEVKDDSSANLERKVDQMAWELVRQHSQIASFLTARYVVNEFIKIGRTKNNRMRKDELKYVYPYRINRFAKEILTQSIDNEGRALDGIIKVLDRTNAHEYAKSHAVYLAGRITSRQLKEQAIEKLREYLARLLPQIETMSLADDGDRHRFMLLLVRTAYISLAYLGDENASPEYVDKLLKDREWDRFNRGFHLEYYGDQVYSPDKALLSDDSLEAYPRTFEQLSGRLRSGSRSPLFEIEVQTLVSLSVQRHAKGALEEANRNITLEVIRDLGPSTRLRSQPLKSFIRMAEIQLTKESFSPLDPFFEAYSMKVLPRTGWVKRGIKNPESVADHSYGCFLIGLFFLPTEFDCPNYSKDRILKMLLVHDMAEGRYGDYLPEEATDQKRAEEKSFFEELSVLSIYQGIADMHDLFDIWQEFENRSSINAVIAKEIDKIENYVQLFLYRKRELVISDFQSWKRTLEDQVSSELGTRILRNIADYFSDN